MDGIEFSATADGNVKCERKIAGIVVDRFIARRNHPLAIKLNKPRSWITKAQMILMQPSAGVVIQLPPFPALEPTQADRLASVQSQLEDAQEQLRHYASLVEEKQL